MTQPRCPKCRSGAMIRTLSAVHAEGSAILDSTGATYRTELARQVAPPEVTVHGPQSLGCILTMILAMIVCAAVLVGSFSSLAGIVITPVMGLLIVSLGFGLYAHLETSQSVEERDQRVREREVWKDALYCRRDHLVFVPGSKWRGPPSVTRDICKKVAEERKASLG